MKNWIKSNELIILILLVLAFLLGCVYLGSSPESASSCCGKEVDYGEGVYYFPCRQDEFGRTLAQFVRDSEFDKFEIAAITSDNTGTDGWTKGYFVVVRSKDKCEPPSGINK